MLEKFLLYLQMYKGREVHRTEDIEGDIQIRLGGLSGIYFYAALKKGKIVRRGKLISQ